MRGTVADSCFTAAYGGTLVIVPDADERRTGLTRGGQRVRLRRPRRHAPISPGRAGNRFGVCLRKSHEGSGPRVVVEGVAANAFQYMTGGTALVLGPTGFNLGSGMTGGVVYLLDHDPEMLNRDYVPAHAARGRRTAVRRAARRARGETGSRVAEGLLDPFDPGRFARVATRIAPEPLE